MEMYDPSHAGQILRVYMGDMVSVSDLAKRLKMTRANLSMILNGRLGVSAMMAIKFSEVFPNTDPEFWLSIQNNYDLARARRKKRAKIAPLYSVKSTPAKKTSFRKAA